MDSKGTGTQVFSPDESYASRTEEIHQEPHRSQGFEFWPQQEFAPILLPEEWEGLSGSHPAIKFREKPWLPRDLPWFPVA